MARDILSEFGNDKSITMQERAKSGGEKSARDVMNYKPPCGPIGIGHSGPGLGGANLGNAGTQGRHSTGGDGESGSPGLHGDNRGTRGTQR